MRLPEYRGLRWIPGLWEEAREHDRRLRTLRFTRKLERAYLDDYLDRSIGSARFGAAIVLFLYIVFGITELRYGPQMRRALWLLRYGIDCPYIAAGIIFSYRPGFKRWMQTIVIAGLLLLGFSSIAHFWIEARTESLLDLGILASVLTITFAVYTLARLRATLASVVGWSLMIAYMTAMALTPGPWRDRLLGNCVTLLLFNLLGMAAAHSVERYLRRDFLLTRAVEAERRKSERLLLSILPEPIAERLKRQTGIIADSFDQATVLFADIRGFTALSTHMEPVRLVGLLNDIFSHFDDLTLKHGLEKIKTSGDAYMAVGGIPATREDHVGAAAELALEMRKSIKEFDGGDGVPLDLRIGIHTGPVVAGVIGTNRFVYDLWGDTVNVASRMERLCIPGCIQVSPAAYERLQGRYLLEKRGEIEVKGRGAMTTYLLVDRSQAYAVTSVAQEAGAVPVSGSF